MCAVYLCIFENILKQLVVIGVHGLDSDSSFDKRLVSPLKCLHVLYESNSSSVTEYVCSQTPCPRMQAREARKAADF